MRNKLAGICSNIACKHLKAGDRVELISDNKRDLGGNGILFEGEVGQEFIINDIRRSFGGNAYIMVGNLGYWANCFRKISK